MKRACATWNDFKEPIYVIKELAPFGKIPNLQNISGKTTLHHLAQSQGSYLISETLSESLGHSIMNPVKNIYCRRAKS